MWCGECGNSVRPGDRSCSTCRAALPDSQAPVTAMGSGFARSHPTDEVSPERSPGRGRVVLVAVLAMIAAAAGGGIAYALLGQDARPAGSDRAGATDTTASHESAPVADPADEQDQPKEDVTDDGGAGSRPIRVLGSRPG